MTHKLWLKLAERSVGYLVKCETLWVKVGSLSRDNGSITCNRTHFWGLNSNPVYVRLRVKCIWLCPLGQSDAPSSWYSGGRGFDCRVRPHIFRRDLVMK